MVNLYAKQLAKASCQLFLGSIAPEEFSKLLPAGGPPALRLPLALEGVYGLCLHLALQHCPERHEQVGLEFQGEFARAARARHHLQELDQHCFAAGLEVVALKGACFQLTLYPNLGTRGVSDLDLWVQRTDLPALSKMLPGLGYAVQPDGLNWSRQGGALDLHLHPLNQWAQLFPGADSWWNSRRALGTLRAVRQLGPEESLLATALHGLKHAFRRWIWILDVALLWRRVYLPRAHALACALRCERLFWMTSAILVDLLGEERPPNLPLWNRWERRLMRGVAHRDAPEEAGMLLPFSSEASLWRKARYSLQLAYPKGLLGWGRSRRLGSIGRQLWRWFRTEAAAKGGNIG